MSSRLTFELSKAICDAVLRRGAELGAPPLAVAVVDDRGCLRCHYVQNDMALAMGRIAQGKANASISLNVDGDSLGKWARSDSGISSAYHGLSDPWIPLAGGVLIKMNGQVIGAVGVTGDTAERDDQIARDAINTCLG